MVLVLVWFEYELKDKYFDGGNVRLGVGGWGREEFLLFNESLEAEVLQL